MVGDKIYKWALTLPVGLFVVETLLWLWLVMNGHVGDKVAHLFGGTYGLVALSGGIYGLVAARSWGFLRSYFGKTIIFLSLGLLLQEFGQLAFTYLYIIVGIDVPYPSLADVGFFGAIPMYIAGAYCLAKGLGVAAIIKKSPYKLVVGVIVPLLILVVSYWFFLKDYDGTAKDWLTVFLDFGYPLGQSVYVSAALVTLLGLGGLLGGTMRRPVLLLLLAFLLQYVADFTFLYQSSKGSWVNGGYGDYFYLVAYFVMTLSLFGLNRALARAFAKSSAENG